MTIRTYKPLIYTSCPVCKARCACNTDEHAPTVAVIPEHYRGTSMLTRCTGSGERVTVEAR